MSEDNYISWNFTNWVTVVLMAAVGIGILAVVESAVIKMREKKVSAA